MGKEHDQWRSLYVRRAVDWRSGMMTTSGLRVRDVREGFLYGTELGGLEVYGSCANFTPMWSDDATTLALYHMASSACDAPITIVYAPNLACLVAKWRKHGDDRVLRGGTSVASLLLSVIQENCRDEFDEVRDV
jgi:hypothetical protein